MLMSPRWQTIRMITSLSRDILKMSTSMDGTGPAHLSRLFDVEWTKQVRRPSGLQSERVRVEIGLEAHENFFPSRKLENRPFDHRRLRHHESDGLLRVEVRLVRVIEFAKRRTRTIEHDLPTDILHPAFQTGAVDAFRFVVMESVGDAVRVEPRSRRLHRVAILDAVDGDGCPDAHNFTTK